MHIVGRTIACGWMLALAIVIPQAAEAAAPVLTTLYNFPGGANGALPETGLTAGPAGVYYGSTYGGGTSNWGTVYQLTPPTAGGSWTETVLYNFTGGTDGANPKSALILDSSNNLYGTTVYGGAHGFGTVFELIPPITPGDPWTETVLYSFQGGADGARPTGDLVMCANATVCSPGTIFGVTTYGGTGAGTVYKLSPPAVPGGLWTEEQLHVFQGGSNDGASPMTGLLMQLITLPTSGQGMLLYGTTYQGGAAGWGLVFQLVPPSTAGQPWKENIVYSFTGLKDGGGPLSNLYVSGKAIYGTTFWNGSNKGCILGGFITGCGTLYQLTPASKTTWTFKVIYTFTGYGPDGAHPWQALSADQNGAVYVTTYSGGGTSDVCYGAGSYPGCGTIMRFKPGGAGAWTPAILHKFSGNVDGGSPNGAIRNSTGQLFGTTTIGGNGTSAGTAYELQ